MKRILVLIFLLVLAGCQSLPAADLPPENESGENPVVDEPPTPQPTEIQITPPAVGEPADDDPIKLAPLDLIELAARDLVARLEADLEAIQVESFQEEEWPDGGLGCPLPDTEYAQVITPGYSISLEVEGTTYTYHTDQGTLVVLCLEDGPESLPVIPIPEGERIMDGIPWKPVDPPPDEGEVADPDPVK